MGIGRVLIEIQERRLTNLKQIDWPGRQYRFEPRIKLVSRSSVTMNTVGR